MIKQIPCRYFCKLYLESKTESPLIAQNKWAQEIRIQIDDWSYIYSSPFTTTRNTKLQNFQFKLSHRITATSSTGPNRLLHAGIKITDG